MAANNSTLQIEVVSTGIKEAAGKLDTLGNAAGRTETKVKKLTDSLGLLMVAQNSAVSAAAQHANLMNAIAQQMGLASSAAKDISKSVTKLTADLALMTDAAGRSTQALQRKSSAGGIVNSTIRAMTTAALAYLGINFAKGIIEAADGWKMMQARLKLATGSMEEAKRVQGDLFDMAQRLRIPLEDAGKLYTRMAVPMARMGQSAQKTAEQVEYVSLALKLNGATAGEASSVMLQYSQSVNAGRLNGAEFNAVAEGAPGILRAIEAELKATGKWSEHSGKTLKQMGADGELTFDLMNRAAQRALPEMRKAFDALPLTVDGAVQRVKNAWFKAMGEMGEKTDMGEKLAKAIGQLEADIPKIRDALASTFMFLHDNFGKIVFVIEAIVLGKFVQWIAGAALALPGLVTGLMATATAMGGAATGLGVLRVAFMALTGPVGILVGLVGTALVAAWQYFGKEAPKADAAVTASTKVHTVNRIELIQKEIDKINERNAAAAGIKAASAAYVVTDSDKEQVALITKINGLKSAQGGVIDKGAKEAYKPAIDLLEGKLKLIQGQQTVLTALQNVNAEALRNDKVKGIRAELAKDSESKTAQANREVQEARDRLKEHGALLKDEEELAIRRRVMGKGGEGASQKAAEAQISQFAQLRASILAHNDALREQIVTEEKVTASEKLRFAMTRGVNPVYNKGSATEQAEMLARVDDGIALEAQIEATKKLNAEKKALAAEQDRYTAGLVTNNASMDDQLVRLNMQIAALTMTKAAVKDLAATEYERESDKAIIQAQMLGPTKDLEQYNALIARAEKFQALADGTRALGKGQDEKEAYKLLDDLLDPKKALDFGDALSGAFGKAGDAIGKMAKALGSYGKVQDKIDDDRAKLMSLAPDAKRAAGLAALDTKEVQSKLRAYGDIAAGAKDLMSEHTAGYKIMHATEKAFRFAEMAMTIESTALKVWASLTATTAVTAESTAVVAGASLQVGATGAVVAASGVRTASYVMEGAAAMFAWLGPWGTVAVAGMLAVMAGLGFSGGGSSATPIDFKDRQAKQHSGTVLGGDAESKSASIANAMDMVADNSNIGLVLTSNMLSSLRGIEASMQGLAAAIFKVNGMTTGKNFGVTEGKSGGGIVDSIFGGATVTTIMDTGLKLNGTADQFRNGQGAEQFVDVNKQEDGGWFSSDKSWNERNYMAANDEITKTVGRVFDSINSTIVDAAGSLGANGDAIGEALDLYVVNTEVSFKDLTGDDLKQALEDMFSATADGMARTVFAGFEAFQVAGEGYYETILRVATGSEQASNALEGFGIQMVDVKSLTVKSGDIASELVRQSIMAVESGTTMADIMKVMDGSMSDLIDGYKALLNIQDTMRGAGLGKSVSMDTIRGAGGISELESAMDEFIEGFYSDAEKQVVSFSKLRAEFGRLNVVMPATKDGFKQLVTNLMAGDAASQELAGRVLMLGGAFADAFTAAEEARKDAVDEATDLLTEAYDKEAEALENIIDKMKDFSESLADFRNTLITGDLSTKSTFEKYATAKAMYEDVSTRAATGDETAIGSFEKVASEFLKLSRDVNASGVNYTADYDRVLLETETLRKFTSTQVDVATASLDALKEQVKGMIKLDESVLSVTAAVVALHTAMATEGPGIDGSHAGGLSSVPFNGYIAELHKGEAVLTASENNEYRANLGNVGVKTDAAMVNELKALREELKQLREEQRDQTSNMIGAQYNSQELNAQMVVAGTKGAMEDASYLERTKTGLV